jgi:hypothetical protein
MDQRSIVTAIRPAVKRIDDDRKARGQGKHWFEGRKEGALSCKPAWFCAKVHILPANLTNHINIEC